MMQFRGGRSGARGGAGLAGVAPSRCGLSISARRAASLAATRGAPRGPRAKLGPLFLLIVAALQLVTAALAQIIGPNLNLTKAAGNQYEPAVAINPGNNN